MKSIITIKADKEVKENAQILAEELGVPLSVLINAYLKHFIRTREVVFSAIPHMTPALESVVDAVEKDIAMGKNISKGFTNSDDMDAYLDSL